jgi:homoserine O-succinyltransferase
MSWNEKRSVKVAILDLYEGKANQGMRCIRTILKEFAETSGMDVTVKEYDVRLKNELPDTS